MELELCRRTEHKDQISTLNKPQVFCLLNRTGHSRSARWATEGRWRAGRMSQRDRRCGGHQRWSCALQVVQTGTGKGGTSTWSRRHSGRWWRADCPWSPHSLHPAFLQWDRKHPLQQETQCWCWLNEHHWLRLNETLFTLVRKISGITCYTHLLVSRTTDRLWDNPKCLVSCHDKQMTQDSVSPLILCALSTLCAAGSWCRIWFYTSLIFLDTLS